MKVLKLISTGLIVFEDFNLPLVSAPLTVNAELTYGSSYVEYLNGSIYFNAAPYNSLVVEIDNSFVPTKEGDMGGIRLESGSETRELYEYYDPDNDIGAIPFVKVIKNGNTYSGYGSNNGLDWIYRGDVYFAPIDTLHISAIGTSIYRLNSIKVYKSENITIHSLLPGYKVEAYQSGVLKASSTAEGQSTTIKLPEYPFTGTIKILNDENTLISEVNVSNIWGRDEYSLSTNVDIYDDTNTILTMQSARHMGHLDNGILEKIYRIHNNNNYQINAVLSIADYSPFGNWVKLSNESELGLPVEYLDSITIPLEANEDKFFWVKIQRPIDADTTYDYRQNEALWYLVVE